MGSKLGQGVEIRVINHFLLINKLHIHIEKSDTDIKNRNPGGLVCPQCTQTHNTHKIPKIMYKIIH